MSSGNKPFEAPNPDSVEMLTRQNWLVICIPISSFAAIGKRWRPVPTRKWGRALALWMRRGAPALPGGERVLGSTSTGARDRTGERSCCFGLSYLLFICLWFFFLIFQFSFLLTHKFIKSPGSIYFFFFSFYASLWMSRPRAEGYQGPRPRGKM